MFGVDGNTEVFTKRGWISLRDYFNAGCNDLILQYDKSGWADLVKPVSYNHVKTNEPFLWYKGNIIDLVATQNYPIVYKDVGSIALRSNPVMHKGKLVETYDNSKGFNEDSVLNLIRDESSAKLIITSFNYDGPRSPDFDSLEIAFFLVLNQARYDIVSKKYILNTANLVSNSIPDLLQEELKSRKRGKSNSAITTEGYTFKISKSGLEELISVYKDGSIGYSDVFYQLSFECKDDLIYVFDDLDDVITDKDKIDVMQFILSSTGRNAVIYDSDEFGTYEMDNYGYNSYGSFASGSVDILNDEDKYSLTVPSHMLVLRRNGKIFVAGDGSGIL